MDDDPYFNSERFSAYWEWMQTSNDNPVITRADGSQEEHPYRETAWRAYKELAI